METGKISVLGMADQKDVDKVRQALHEVWGIRRVEVSLDKGEAVFTYDEQAASLADFQQAIRDYGFAIQTPDKRSDEATIN